MMDPTKFSIVKEKDAVEYLKDIDNKQFGVIADVACNSDDTVAKFRVVSYHLSSGSSVIDRKRQLQRIKEALEAKKSKLEIPVIMSGDMNTDMEAMTEEGHKTAENVSINRQLDEMTAVNFTKTDEFLKYREKMATVEVPVAVKSYLETFDIDDGDTASGSGLILKMKHEYGIDISPNDGQSLASTMKRELTRLKEGGKLTLRPATTGKMRVLSAQPGKIGMPLAHAIDSVSLISDSRSAIKRQDKSVLPFYPEWMLNLLSEESSVSLFYALEIIYKSAYGSENWPIGTTHGNELPKGFRPDEGILLFPHDGKCPSDHLPVVTEFKF
jgi:hypothetical protein